MDWDNLTAREKKNKVESILERIASSFGVDYILDAKDKNGEKVFKSKKTTVESWISLGRPKFPWKEVLLTHELTGVTIDYLVDGPVTSSIQAPKLEDIKSTVANAVIEATELELVDEDFARPLTKYICKQLDKGH